MVLIFFRGITDKAILRMIGVCGVWGGESNAEFQHSNYHFIQRMFYHLSSAFLGYPQLFSALLRSPQLSSAVLSSPQLSSAVLSSPQLSSALLDSPRLSAALCSSPQLSSALLSSPQLSLSFLTFPYVNVSLTLPYVSLRSRSKPPNSNPQGIK